MHLQMTLQNTLKMHEIPSCPDMAVQSNASQSHIMSLSNMRGQPLRQKVSESPKGSGGFQSNHTSRILICGYVYCAFPRDSESFSVLVEPAQPAAAQLCRVISSSNDKKISARGKDWTVLSSQ